MASHAKILLRTSDQPSLFLFFLTPILFVALLSVGCIWGICKDRKSKQAKANAKLNDKASGAEDLAKLELLANDKQIPVSSIHELGQPKLLGADNQTIDGDVQTHDNAPASLLESYMSKCSSHECDRPLDQDDVGKEMFCMSGALPISSPDVHKIGDDFEREVDGNGHYEIHSGETEETEGNLHLPSEIN